MLLRYNADTEVAGRAYGTTSLVAAAQHGHADVVAMLLRGAPRALALAHAFASWPSLLGARQFPPPSIY